MNHGRAARHPVGGPAPYLRSVRRPALVVWFVVLAVGLVACAYDPEIEPPGAATGVSAPEPSASSGPVSTTPAFTPDGCPVDDAAFCEQAAALANALVLSDGDAVFDLSRPGSWACADLDRELFPQCEHKDRLKGYRITTNDGRYFVNPPAAYRQDLTFFVEAVDDEYSDELGGPQMQILGISTCGRGTGTSYHVVYTVALGDPDSTLPGDRFLGTYEFTQLDGSWAVTTATIGLLTDWQLILDDPLTQIACGDIQPWAGVLPTPNASQSESQPTPEPETGS